MQTKKIVVASIFFLLMTTLGVIFRPDSNSREENAVKVTGKVEKVLENPQRNIVFKLQDDDRFYLIQKQLDRDLSLEQLQRDLPGKSVEIYYIKRWTPVDPLRVTHVTKVDFNKMTLYSRK